MTIDGQVEKGLNRRVHKTSTGIRGLDEITNGGLPAGRPTLLCGSAGSGKTLLAIEFIVRGVMDYNENGVFISFEESKEDLYDNVATLGFDLEALEKDKRIHIREIALSAQDDVQLGDYDLEGLFSQIGFVIDSVGAKRIVIDGIETLFSSFSEERIIRSELSRLIRWLKDRGMSAIITSERGEGAYNISRHNIEEYISDCVILLDQRIVEQVVTRRLRVLKYRGSSHGSNEYPFLITNHGISVFPITSMTLEHEASTKHVSTGVDKLDVLFDGKGYYQGSSVLITGSAGTGKSTFAASFAKNICESGNQCIYFSFEESEKQILRNMASVGLELKPYIDQNLLKIHAVRPTLQGLELHLLSMHTLIDEIKPAAVILDPISNLDGIGTLAEIKMMFIRIIDFLKENNISSVFTALTPGRGIEDTSEVGLSSIMDTWVLLSNQLRNGQRERSLNIMKARGIKHSHQVQPFEINGDGIVIHQTNRHT